MPPSVDFTPSATPADFSLPSPLPLQTLAGSAVQFSGAAALRYLVKFSVVPDSSERKKTLIAVDGRVAPGLIAATASTTPSFSAVFSAESEPAKSTWPAMNCLMPAPDPVGL